jgi:hypothetical protein
MAGDHVAPELQAICERCLLPVADGEGALWVQPPPPRARHDGQSALTMSMADLLQDRDERAVWHTTHDTCAPAQTGYRIAVERIRTWAAYLHWTAHLMSKSWILDTTWSDLILDSLDPTSATVGGIRPLKLRDPGHRDVGD